MSNIKRVLRKVRPRSGTSFDEQLWPVNLALLVLGSFLAGVVLAYLRFDDPRWYANAWTSLLVIPLVIGGSMLALRKVNSRVVRRGVQLAAVLSLLVHVIFLIIGLRAKLFSTNKPDPKVARQLVPPPKRVAMPDYQKHHLVDPEKRPTMEFEKPVETPTPEPEPEQKVDRQETKPEKQPEQPQTAPAPTPEPKETPQPTVAKQKTPAETVPRLSEQQSKLSRQVTKTQPRPNQAADAPEVTRPAESPTPKVEAQASAVSRQSPDAQANVKTKVADPTAAVAQPTVQLSRRETQPSPTPETTAQPTMQRPTARPTVTPRSQVQVVEAPAATQKTAEATLAPRTTSTTRQENTASPQVAQKTTEPTPESPSKPAAKPERRQHESPPQPTVAQTPAPVPNPRPRATVRPDAATVASTVAPSPTASPTARPTLEAQASAVPRKTVDAPSEKRPTPTEPTPSPTQQPVASLTRRESQPTPAAQPAAVAQPSLARQASRPTVAPSAQTAAAQPTAVARQTQSSDVAPTSVATRKQASESPQVAKSSGEPTPASGPRANVALASPSTSKQQTAQSGPQVGAAKNVVPGRQSASATSNVVTNVADVAANSSPTQSADFNPQPSSAQVARQSSAPSESAVRTQTPLEAPQLAASNQIAQGSAQRAQSNSLPGLTMPTGASNSPARAARTAAAAASPVNAESPALAAAAQGQGDTSAQPARMALSKSLAGVAGAGRSANLDTAAPNGDSPAMVASGSARRAEAMQNTPAGAALAPSAPATISRSVAGADRPSSTIKAEPVELATTGGTQSVGEINASSSAAVVQANSNAKSGPITAAAGQVEVDIGPTQIVADKGTGRAAGGGQPELNFEASTSQQLARSKAGGAPQMSLAADARAAVPEAPSGGQPGSPPAVEINSLATATARTEAGGAGAVSGGPSNAEKGPSAEVNAAPLLADAALSRADTASAAAGGGAAGQPDVNDETEEEKARRLARSAGGGAPKVALAAAVVAEAPTSAPGDGAAAEAMLAADSVATATARADLGRQIPGGVAGPAAVEATGGETAGGGGELVGPTTVNRAEAVDSAVGAPVAGGGTGSPTRASAGAAFVANTQAAEVSIAGAPESGGAAQGSAFEASGLSAAKLAGGAPGAAASGPVGAAAGEVTIDAVGGLAPGTAIGARQASSGAGDGPTTTASTNAGAPLRRAEQTGLSGGVQSDSVVEIPQVAAILAQADDDHLGGAMTKGSIVRRAAGGLSVELAMADGPGGLGLEITPDVGITRRPASAESVDVQLKETRFIRQAVGGLPSTSTAAVVSTDMFKRRIDRAQGKKDAGGAGGEPQTEDAIERGLTYLARQQSPNGSWTLRGTGEPVALSSDTAATALSTLAFLGAGYHHRDFKFKDNVRTALDFLISHQRPDGDLFVPLDDESNRSVRLYSHAIATMALCEAYLCTNDEALKAPAQRALDFIVASQHKEHGGWRYTPGISADTSVTGWMVVALKYGRDGGFKVPPETFAKINRWVSAAQASPAEKHLYRYNPYAPDTESQRHGRQATKTMTAVGLMMRIYQGEKAAAPDLVRGAQYLAENPPALGSLREPQRDTYYWYYATLFMHYMGGEHWESWNKALHPLLVDSQIKDGPQAGSWDPRTPIPDRWAFHAGRLYVTTMNLLSLEVRWRGLRQSDNAGK